MPTFDDCAILDIVEKRWNAMSKSELRLIIEAGGFDDIPTWIKDRQKRIDAALGMRKVKVRR